MPGNSFGKALVLTTFGESHGVATGGILDGFPSNFPIDEVLIQKELDRRRPGQDFFSTPRQETDRIRILSGIYEGRTTGAPIAFMVLNEDHQSVDYQHLANIFRPSHADFTWNTKYGTRDPRGGGRASARETLARVAGGGFAKQLLFSAGIRISSSIAQIGPFRLQADCRDSGDLPVDILEFLEKLKEEGNTTGGVVGCTITGVPPGLGEPVFDKLQADLAKAMLSINSVKGFEYGEGFRAAAMKGSEHNDLFLHSDQGIRTATNHSGGIQGGISNGEEINFHVAFKPVATLMMTQECVDSDGKKVEIPPRGRHDVCVVPRALPIVEAMTALVIADHMIRNNSLENKWNSKD